MLRLDRVLRRRRGVVLALWLVALVAAVPFAARQSDHLTGGGYGVPGSQSEQVEDALERDFGQAGRARRSPRSLVPREGADARRHAPRAAPRRARRARRAARSRVREPTPRARGRRRGARPAGRSSSRSRPPSTSADAIDVAADLRERLGLPGEPSAAPSRTHLVGQGALWARMQEVAKEDVEKAERARLPDRRADPARRLRLARRRGAAARARLRQRCSSPAR